MENTLNEQIPLSLWEKIQLVSNDIKNIEKNMQVGDAKYGYKAVSDIDVVLAVKDAETKHRIISIPVRQELVKSEVIRTVKDNGKEGITYVDIIKMTLRIINLDNTAECVEIESFGRGLDSGDKGFGKAATYARKYALLNAYKIATGEDPDKNKSQEELVNKKDEKKTVVTNYMNKDNKFLQNTLQHFSVGTIEDLSDKQIEYIYNVLLKRNLL
ncbi:MAG: hypothetical protein EGP82_10155 [Odoribacter splanchnicus]|nr:hypothetical protein [Odoribacter splanchnicus]